MPWPRTQATDGCRQTRDCKAMKRLCLAASRVPASELQQPNSSLISVGIVLKRRIKFSSKDNWAYWEEPAVSLKAAPLCHSPGTCGSREQGCISRRLALPALLVLPRPVLRETGGLFRLAPWEHPSTSPSPHPPLHPLDLCSLAATVGQHGRGLHAAGTSQLLIKDEPSPRGFALPSCRVADTSA